MYLGIDRPKAASWSLVNADWVGDSNGSLLFSGQPREVSRLQCAAGSFSSISLRGTWPGGVVPRIGCIVGLNLPAGLPLVFTGMPASSPVTYNQALGGNSTSQRTVRFADGSVGAWWWFDDALPACVGLSITISNDGALTPLVPGAFVDIGEVGFWRGVLFGDHGISRGWSDGEVEPVTARAIDRTPWPEPRLSGRSFEFSSNLLREQNVFGDGGSAGINLSQIRHRALAGETIAAVRRRTSGTPPAFDAAVLNAHALLGGFTRFDKFVQQAGSLYSTAAAIEEYGAWPSPAID